MVKAFGTGAGLRMSYQLWRQHPEAVIRPPGHAGDLRMRRKTADVCVFEQIFVNGEYAIDGLRQPTWILDLGGHIGFSAVWFAHRFPGVPILAVEPDEDNFRLL